MTVFAAACKGFGALCATGTRIEVCSCILTVCRFFKILAAGILCCIAMTVFAAACKGFGALCSARAGIEVCSRVFAICRLVKIFAVGILYSVAVCMLVRQILTVGIALSALITERVIVRISVRAGCAIVNILAVGVAFAAFIAERVVVRVSVLTDRGVFLPLCINAHIARKRSIK